MGQKMKVWASNTMNIRLQELEQENSELKEFISENESRETELCILVENLKGKIEKMKCCENCKYHPELYTFKTNCKDCHNSDRWELHE